MLEIYYLFMEITNKLPALFHLILDAFLVILIKKRRNLQLVFFQRKILTPKRFVKRCFRKEKE